MTTSNIVRDLSYLVACAHRRLHYQLERSLQAEGLSVEQWRVLAVLNDKDGCSMGELAELVLMNHPALTKLADRMVADGLIHRFVDKNDQRRVLVNTTERGSVFYGRLKGRVTEHNRILEGGIGVSKSAALRALLEDILIQDQENISA